MALSIFEHVVVAEWRAISHWTRPILGCVIPPEFVQRSIDIFVVIRANAIPSKDENGYTRRHRIVAAFCLQNR